MKKASETTIIKTLVQLKCLGRCPCLNTFSAKERGRVFDELEKRGYIDSGINILPSAKDVILNNLHLV